MVKLARLLEEGKIDESANNSAEDDSKEDSNGKSDVGLAAFALGADHGGDIIIDRGSLGGSRGNFWGNFLFVDRVARERALFKIKSIDEGRFTA